MASGTPAEIIAGACPGEPDADLNAAFIKLMKREETLRFIRLKAIIRKEIYHLIRDYRSLYLAFAIPLILIILFGYALSLDVNNVETVFVDYDKSDLSRDFIRKLDASSYFHVSTLLPETKIRD